MQFRGSVTCRKKSSEADSTTPLRALRKRQATGANLVQCAASSFPYHSLHYRNLRPCKLINVPTGRRFSADTSLRENEKMRICLGKLAHFFISRASSRPKIARPVGTFINLQGLSAPEIPS